jgi:hypothetical protein
VTALNILGKVTTELPADRGLDVTYTVMVPPAWLAESGVLLVQLPRLLACAECEGGGCDACERRGAAVLHARGEPQEVLRVKLSAAVAPEGTVLRLPEHGAIGASPEQARGCLLLKLLPGELSKGVEREQIPEPTPPAPIRWSPYLSIALGLVVALIIAAACFD